MTNNHLYQNARGITLDAAASSGSRIINNTVARNTGDGIAVRDCAPFFKNNLIVSNTSVALPLEGFSM